MATQAKTKPLEWPICIVDFEASSLSKQSYPIEVGVCLCTDPDLPVRLWGSLIRPTEKWLESQDWSDEAFAVHGITQEDLQTGLTPEEIRLELLKFCAPADLVFCDGGDHDHHWHNQLCAAAGAGTGMVLASLQKMLFHHELYEPYAERAESANTRHRAIPDCIEIITQIADVAGIAIEIDLSTIEHDPIQAALAKEAWQP